MPREGVLLLLLSLLFAAWKSVCWPLHRQLQRQLWPLSRLFPVKQLPARDGGSGDGARTEHTRARTHMVQCPFNSN